MAFESPIHGQEKLLCYMACTKTRNGNKTSEMTQNMVKYEKKKKQTTGYFRRENMHYAIARFFFFFFTFSDNEFRYQALSIEQSNLG